MSEYVLQMKGICKSFPGVKALDNVSLNLHPGTVHALMGENGAEESTADDDIIKRFHGFTPWGCKLTVLQDSHFVHNFTL